jgi:hypothetical protein
MKKKDSKKPPLTLVDQTTTGNAPPRKLGEHGLSLWNAVTAEYQIDDRGGIEILTQICAASDRVEALAAQINEDGETIRTRTGVLKAHPCLKDELALRAFICRGLERLGLNIETLKSSVGRPAGMFGWRDDDGH